MRNSLNMLNAALVAIGISGFATQALAETRYYDPTNTAKGSDAGKTTGFELFKTIGCPGRQLLDPPCKEDAPAPKPAPVVAKPAPAPAPAPAPKPVTKTECMANAKPGECYVMIVQEPVYRTEKVKKLVKEASEKIETTPASPCAFCRGPNTLK